MKYIKQLDTVRALAIFLVIIQHWGLVKHRLDALPPGEVGVDVFFVLSGFLITCILLANRETADEDSSKWLLVKNFYARRCLRIFPLYYITIFLLYFINFNDFDDIRAPFIYFLTYTQNFYIYSNPGEAGSLTHFWTLAIEEQFYLLWPFIILFVKRKYLIHVIILFIIIGFVSEIVMGLMGMGRILTPACLHAFGIGALLSWFIRYKPDAMISLFKKLSYAAVICLFLLLFNLFAADGSFQWFPLRAVVSVIAMWLILYIFNNQQKEPFIFKWLLNNRLLIFIGKISYGLYIFHNLEPRLLNLKLVNVYFNPLLPLVIRTKYFGILFLLENIVLTLFICWISYVFIEMPFLWLKRYFNYVPPPGIAVSEGPIANC